MNCPCWTTSAPKVRTEAAASTSPWTVQNPMPPSLATRASFAHTPDGNPVKLDPDWCVTESRGSDHRRDSVKSITTTWRSPPSASPSCTIAFTGAACPYDDGPLRARLGPRVQPAVDSEPDDPTRARCRWSMRSGRLPDDRPGHGTPVPRSVAIAGEIATAATPPRLPTRWARSSTVRSPGRSRARTATYARLQIRTVCSLTGPTRTGSALPSLGGRDRSRLATRRSSTAWDARSRTATTMSIGSSASSRKRPGSRLPTRTATTASFVARPAATAGRRSTSTTSSTATRASGSPSGSSTPRASSVRPPRARATQAVRATPPSRT